MKIFQPTITGSFTVVTGSSIEFQVTNTGVKIGSAVTDVHTITGSLNISSSAAIVSATEIGYLSGSTTQITNFDDFTINKALSLAGSGLKGTNLLVSSPANITVAVNMSSGTARFVAIYLSKPQLITGVKWYMSTAGAYTANNYNGVGLYTASAGTLACVASSSNNANTWSSSLWSSGTFASASFGSQYSASAGIYWIGTVHNSSAQSTVPAFGSGTAVLNSANAANPWTVDLPNSIKISAVLSGQTALPSSQAMSGLIVQNATNGAFWLY